MPESTNPIYGPFFGVMGAASAIIFSCEYKFCTNLAATNIDFVQIVIFESYINEISSAQGKRKETQTMLIP